jgi:hypothetical protein
LNTLIEDYFLNYGFKMNVQNVVMPVFPPLF